MGCDYVIFGFTETQTDVQKVTIYNLFHSYETLEGQAGMGVLNLSYKQRNRGPERFLSWT